MLCLFATYSLGFQFLVGNNLRGTIPEEIGSVAFVDLEVLKLQDNYGLHGTIPSSIGSKLTHLTSLQLGGNYLTGNIPDTFRQLTNLKLFNVSYNLLDGSLLEVNRGSIITYTGSIFWNMKQLVTLDLSRNLFDGWINNKDLSFWAGITGNGRTSDDDTVLRQFVVDDNMFLGVLPEALELFSNSLQVLSMSSNMFVETLPTVYGKLTNLKVLQLHNNTMITGTIPTELIQLSSLRKFVFLFLLYV